MRHLRVLRYNYRNRINSKNDSNHRMFYLDEENFISLSNDILWCFEQVLVKYPELKDKIRTLKQERIKKDGKYRKPPKQTENKTTNNRN